MFHSSSHAVRVLHQADLRTVGKLRSASNVVLLCELVGSNAEVRSTLSAKEEADLWCVYKPVKGERPLWDFPDGSLAGREIASFVISDTLGWSLIPPTALRDGPYGKGTVQQWVKTTGSSLDDLVGLFVKEQTPQGWRAMLVGRDGAGSDIVLAHADHPRLRQLAVLDVLLNNADRKGGHILLNTKEDIQGIDQGLCLHEEPKLRTVLWGWSGEPIHPEYLADIQRLCGDLEGHLSTVLSEYLTEGERTALAERAHRLLVDKTMPLPEGDRMLPWPLM